MQGCQLVLEQVLEVLDGSVFDGLRVIEAHRADPHQLVLADRLGLDTRVLLKKVIRHLRHQDLSRFGHALDPRRCVDRVAVYVAVLGFGDVPDMDSDA